MTRKMLRIFRVIWFDPSLRSGEGVNGHADS